VNTIPFPYIPTGSILEFHVKRSSCPNLLNLLAGTMGLEPTASGVTGRFRFRAKSLPSLQKPGIPPTGTLSKPACNPLKTGVGPQTIPTGSHGRR
jgi:hypothetical protein